MSDRFSEKWLETLCSLLPDVHSAVFMVPEPDADQLHLLARWPTGLNEYKDFFDSVKYALKERGEVCLAKAHVVDGQALDFFAWGARSWVCAGSNFAPEAHLALYQACVLDGDFNKGRRIMSAMMPLMRVLEQGGKFIQCIKHGLTLRGFDAGPPRKPLQPLNKDDKRQLAEVIRTMDKTIDMIVRDKG